MEDKPADVRIEVDGHWAYLTDESGMILKKKCLLQDLTAAAVAGNTDGRLVTPILPAGAKYYFKQGAKEIIILEQPPVVKTILTHKWNSFNDAYATIKKYNLAFPFIVYFVYLQNGLLPLYMTRIFYRNAPLGSEDDQLFLANLTHMKSSHAMSSDGYDIGAMCIRVDVSREENLSKKIKAGLEYFWNTEFRFQGGYMYDAFQKSVKLDPRISSLESWEKATNKNPKFILEIPWIETDLTVQKVLKRMAKNYGGADSVLFAPKNSEELADLIYKTEEKEHLI